MFRCDSVGDAVLTVGLTGIAQLDAADQVVEVWAGTTFAELQAELASHGQCLPYAGFSCIAFEGLSKVTGTVGGQLSLNLPHALEADCGNWRDWLLGATVVLADGMVAKAGSRVVKNVTGYDVHRFLVGARGRLGVVAKVALRTFPLKALPPLDLELIAPASPTGYIQRTLRTDFQPAQASAQDLIATNPRTCTLYCSAPPKRFAHDWLIGWGQASANVPGPDPAAAEYTKRAKGIFDPTGKLNP